MSGRGSYGGVRTRRKKVASETKKCDKDKGRRSLVGRARIIYIELICLA